MTTPISLVEHKFAAILMFIAALVFSFPETSLAASPALTGNQSLVFELKQNALKENQAGLSMAEVEKQDELVQAVQAYLRAKKSPLASYSNQIVKLPQWQHALGITFVESNFCSTANAYNCGSLGVGPSSPYWQKFQSPYDGFAALTTLLEKPMYKDRLNTCAKKKGIYVVPGSARWVQGCEKVENELKAIVTQANTAKQAKLVTTTISQTDLALAN